MASLPRPLLTFEEYVALEQRLERKLEYCRGEVFATDEASFAHVYVHSNLIMHLGNRLDGSGWRALGSRLRFYIEASELYTYPDVSIVRQPLEVNERQAAMNPKVLFEIVSASSRRNDVLAKTVIYQQIPSLAEYVMVQEDCHLVQVFQRMANGQWKLTRYEGEDEVLELSSVGIAVPLREIYANVPFELAEREPEQP